MKSTALVTLDCDNGLVRRYLRIEGNKPRETGREEIADWKQFVDDKFVDWTRFWEWLASFRTAYVPPEDPGPRPTPPLRTAIRVAA